MKTVSRLKHIPGIGVDRMGDAADALSDRAMLRLENLDTDIAPPPDAIRATHAAVDRDDANSYLPFQGIASLRQAVCARIKGETGLDYDPDSQCVITAGGLSGMLDVLLATIEPGDEVIITDPAYAGLINRIRLSGGIPKLVPLIVVDGGWRLDLDALRDAASPKVRAVLTMSPSMPSGIVHTPEEWQAIAETVQAADAWLIHDAAMHRLVFDGREPFNPAALPGLAERTIIVGSVSKEYRMIGWRVGWVVGPKDIMADIRLVGLTNVVCKVGIAMPGATAALRTADDGVAAATAQWQARRNTILRECRDLPVVRPDGGWSLLIDTVALGMTPAVASRRCFEKGKIAVTPMTGWGSEQHAGRYLRFVFANEPVERLTGIRQRLRSAWGL